MGPDGLLLTLGANNSPMWPQYANRGQEVSQAATKCSDSVQWNGFRTVTFYDIEAEIHAKAAQHTDDHTSRDSSEGGDEDRNPQTNLRKESSSLTTISISRRLLFVTWFQMSGWYQTPRVPRSPQSPQIPKRRNANQPRSGKICDGLYFSPFLTRLIIR